MRLTFFCFYARDRRAIIVAVVPRHVCALYRPGDDFRDNFFVCLCLTAEGPQRARLPIIPPTATLPSCLWSRRIFPSLPDSRLFMIFYRDASSALLQLVNQWLIFLIYDEKRSPAFRHGSQNKKYDFRKNRTHGFRTSRCTWLPTRPLASQRRVQNNSERLSDSQFSELDIFFIQIFRAQGYGKIARESMPPPPPNRGA